MVIIWIFAKDILIDMPGVYTLDQNQHGATPRSGQRKTRLGFRQTGLLRVADF
jgi:hypothetical protein